MGGPNRALFAVSLLRSFFAALVLGLFGAPNMVMALDVGVAAAVNPEAQRTPPGLERRTLVLGDHLMFEERIETRGDGLVQVLLLDGSTFTIGADSDLVIDEFVYEPEAGGGRLVASFGKGIARFVGGKLSKTEGGVTVKTPVGTIGIRGGIANLVLTEEGARFSLVFGDELTFVGLTGERLRVYRRGYTLHVGRTGGDRVDHRIRRTTPGDLSAPQRALAGRAGVRGGVTGVPSARRQLGAGVSRLNSAQPPRGIRPNPQIPAIRSLNVGAGHMALGDVAGRAHRHISRTKRRLTPILPVSP